MNNRSHTQTQCVIFFPPLAPSLYLSISFGCFSLVLKLHIVRWARVLCVFLLFFYKCENHHLFIIC